MSSLTDPATYIILLILGLVLYVLLRPKKNQSPENSLFTTEPEDRPTPPLETVATFISPMDAEAARSILAGNDIPAMLFDGHLGRIYDLSTSAIGGIRLQVSRDDLTEAQEILRAYDGFENEGSDDTPNAPRTP